MSLRPELLQAFQNRENETRFFKDSLNTLASGEPKLLLFYSEKSFGSTFFLRKLQQETIANDIGIYLDCIEKSIDGFLRNTIFELGEQSQDYSEKIKDKLNRIDQSSTIKKSKNAVISAIPYVGKSIREFTDSPKSDVAASYKLQASPNAILKTISEDFPSERLCIFLDNFDHIDSSQIQYLQELVFFLNDKNTLVVACQNSSEVSKKTLVKLRETGFVTVLRKFGPLSPKDFRAIAQRKNVSIDEAELLGFANDDVYQSLNYIQDKKYSEKNDSVINELTPISRYLVSALSVSEQFVSESFLYRCVESSKLVYCDNTGAISDALEQLRELGICDHFVFLNNSYYQVSSIIRGVLKRQLSLPEVITHTSEIYECLKKSLSDEVNLFSRISDCFFAFSLSLNINKADSGAWASKILMLSLAHKGTFNLLDFIEEYLTPNINYETFLLCLSGAMQAKNYQYFDEVFSKGKMQFQSQKEALILKLICENRLRNYKTAAQYVSILKNTDLDTDLKLLVTSYELINLFHSGKLKEARNLFKQNEQELACSHYSGYLMRIGAGMIPVQDGISILEKALKDFVHYRDEFGLQTTKANLGAYYCKTNKINQGVELLESSYEALLAYGQENVTHCALSLATAYIKQEKHRKARTILQSIINSPEDLHYGLVSQCLMAEIDLLVGDTTTALETFRVLLPKVCKTPTQNIKTRFFINFGLAKTLVAEFDKELDELIALGEKYRPNVLNQKWLDAHQLLKKAEESNTSIDLNEFKDLSLHGYFEYWWFNPLPILMKVSATKS